MLVRAKAKALTAEDAEFAEKPVNDQTAFADFVF
jgi:hypothetical protein